MDQDEVQRDRLRAEIGNGTFSEDAFHAADKMTGEELDALERLGIKRFALVKQGEEVDIRGGVVRVPRNPTEADIFNVLGLSPDDRTDQRVIPTEDADDIEDIDDTTPPAETEEDLRSLPIEEALKKLTSQVTEAQLELLKKANDLYPSKEDLDKACGDYILWESFREKENKAASAIRDALVGGDDIGKEIKIGECSEFYKDLVVDDMQKHLKGVIADELIPKKPVDFKFTRDRSKYVHDYNTIYFGMAQPRVRTTLIHETVHYVEMQNPNMVNRCIEFLEHRTKGEDEQSLREITGIDKYREDEVTRKDKFFDAYCGKSYRLADGKIFATDILSTGIQRIFERPADFQKEDPEHFNFCLLVIDFTQ